MRFKRACVPGEQVQQPRRIQRVAGRKIRLRRQMGVAVPRTDQLAVIAAVNAVAHERSQGFGNGAFVLDGEVADAQPRVEPIGRDDGLGRTDIDAGPATAAMGGDRLVHR